jgi:hypothetical protein
MSGVRKSTRKRHAPDKLCDFDTLIPGRKIMKYKTVHKVDTSRAGEKAADMDALQIGHKDDVDIHTTDNVDSTGAGEMSANLDTLQIGHTDDVDIHTTDSVYTTGAGESKQDRVKNKVFTTGDGSVIIEAEVFSTLGLDEVLQIDIDDLGNATASVSYNEAVDESASYKDSIFDGGPQKQRKRLKDVMRWKKNKAKLLRQHGKEYVRVHEGKEETVPAKEPFLDCSLCRDTCRRKCTDKINDSERQKIFDSYYNISDEDLKNAYLFGCISPVAPKTLRANASKHHAMSFCYSITVDSCKKYVCKTAFAKLHVITNSKIDFVTKQIADGLSAPRPSRKGRHTNRPTKIGVDRLQEVEKHIRKFPAEPSHYSRKRNPNRLYLSSTLSVSEMHRLYTIDCEEEGSPPVSINMYRHIFNTRFNLGFGNPKSDTCSVCDVGHDDDHDVRQKQAYAAQKVDKNAARTSSDTVYCTFDLQKTLPLPKLSTSVAFYLRQVWLYNLGVHALREDKEQAYFHIWTEDEGHRGCEEILSGVLAFLEKANIKKDDKLIFWTDSCTGQNKNFFAVCCWQYLIATNRVKCIDQKFPECGHSYLDSDRDFAHVEKCVRLRQNIYSVDEYQDIMSHSQKKKPPIITRMCDKFHDIKQLPNLLHLHNNPRNTTGCKVEFRNKVRWIRVDKYGQYQYKESHDEAECWKIVRLTANEEAAVSIISFIPKPPKKCSIKPKKLKDITKQLPFIPDIYKSFYTSLTSAADEESDNTDLEETADIETQAAGQTSAGSARRIVKDSKQLATRKQTEKLLLSTKSRQVSFKALCMQMHRIIMKKRFFL